MPFLNTIRIINFHIYMDNLTEAGAGRALDFLLKYKHPDIPLNIHFHHSTKKSLSLKRLVEIFREVPQTYFHFESKDFKELLGSEKELLLRYFGQIRFLKQEDYNQVDEDIIFFKSRGKDVWSIYEVDEGHIDLVGFKQFYDTLGISSSYKINLFSALENKKEFIKNFFTQLKIVYQQNPSFLKPFKQEPVFLMASFKNDIITHRENTGLDIWNNRNIKIIKEKTEDLDKCFNCPVIDECRGGDYTVFEQTDNGDVFCALNMIIRKLILGLYDNKKEEGK